MKLGEVFAIPPKLIPIMGMCFVITLGWGMIVPFLPLVAERVGGRAADSGILLSSFGFARLAVGIPAGAASDRFGRRAVMLFGVILFTLGSLAALASWSVATVAAAFFFIGTGSSCYVTAALAAVADLSDGGGRGRLMSYYQSGVLAGVSVGPAIGGLLIGSFDIRAPFVVQAVVGVAGGIVATLVLQETRRPGSGGSGQASGLAERIRLLAAPPLLAVCVLAFGIYSSRVVATWQVVPILTRDEFGYDPAMIGAMLTAGALANLAALPIASLSIETFGARASIVGAGIAVLIGLALLCVPSSQLSVWASVLMLGAAGSTMATACAAFAASVSKAAHGITMGTLRMSGDLGLVLGPLMLAGILNQFEISVRSGIAVMTIFMAAVLGGFVMVRIDPAEAES